MIIDRSLIEAFETNLDPSHPEKSAIRARVIGYGEISAIFELEDLPGVALKRLPLFTSEEEARSYLADYWSYCKKLGEAGLHLPDDQSVIITTASGAVVLYISQQKYNSEDVCNKILHTADDDYCLSIIARIVESLKKVWDYNSQNDKQIPQFELAIDGQISNWVLPKDDQHAELIYIDTSTPLMRIDGVEKLDPELFLKSAPSFLRWVIRKYFLLDVMARYYIPRQVLVDLVANLYKEQKSSLIPGAVDIVNGYLQEKIPVTEKEIAAYYKEDKLIWQVFLGFRRMDRWITTKVMRNKYEFMLPGKIHR